METKWILNHSVDKQQVAEIVKVLNIDENLATLLVQRGITNYEEAKTFFRPSLSQLHDPFLMKDMDKAVERVISAIDNGEKVLIYGDYDVDGTTAVAVVYTDLKPFFKKKKIEFYIPTATRKATASPTKASTMQLTTASSWSSPSTAVSRPWNASNTPTPKASTSSSATTTALATSSPTPWPCSMPNAPTATILTTSSRAVAWALSWSPPYQ